MCACVWGRVTLDFQNILTEEIKLYDFYYNVIRQNLHLNYGLRGVCYTVFRRDRTRSDLR